MSPSAVVVGIDGSQTAELAMLWAAREAVLREVTLVIAHAAEDGLRASEQEMTGSRFARELMADAQASVFESEVDCRIRTCVSQDNPVRLLTSLASTAQLVVVGSQGLGRISGTVLGSVAFRVAAHASCPVAVLPSEWLRRREAPQGPLVLGLSLTESGRAALAFAFEEASDRGVEIIAVRSNTRSESGETRAALTRPAGWAAEEGWDASVEAALAPYRREYPRVVVSVVSSDGPVQEAIMGAAADPAMLIVGSRFAGGHRYSRLGPVTARLLRRTVMPVVVVGRQVREIAEPDTVTAKVVPRTAQAFG